MGDRDVGDRMTIEEFEAGYAARLGVTVEELRAMGRFAAPCDCGDESCQGFQMAYLGDHDPVFIPSSAYAAEGAT